VERHSDWISTTKYRAIGRSIKQREGKGNRKGGGWGGGGGGAGREAGIYTSRIVTTKVRHRADQGLFGNLSLKKFSAKKEGIRAKWKEKNS